MSSVLKTAMIPSCIVQKVVLYVAIWSLLVGEVGERSLQPFWLGTEGGEEEQH